MKTPWVRNWKTKKQKWKKKQGETWKKSEFRKEIKGKESEIKPKCHGAYRIDQNENVIRDIEEIEKNNQKKKNEIKKK